MLLVVDVGNTNTVVGVFGLDSPEVVTTARMSTRRDRMPDEWYAILAPVLAQSGINPRVISAMVISSVVPNVTRWLSAMGEERLGVTPMLVGVDLDLGIGIDYPNPAEIGPDRLVNSLAAVEQFGAPVISIDFGTAINFDVVNAQGSYIGGALAPGLVVSLDAMVSRAARLFTVELARPAHAIGRTTSEAIQSGVVLGYLSMIEGMIVRIKEELQGDPAVIVTGGYGEIFAEASSHIDAFAPNLTIDGLRLVYERVKRH
ncbi:MAG: Pantothenate kinase type III, CoaX-like [uncultured Thermomicrobiales bacterium]|uniref:Type III pantothenate kinase n=1 Tax=uncultured Thermomicrobiales bacterium TaxID=1645740 RepID=A0A6J4UBW1_9BACT|nr:MAG: Pantothenate kinase type III, CoaX-like [uncultured Thermomicrobiales bacterium]